MKKFVLLTALAATAYGFYLQQPDVAVSQRDVARSLPVSVEPGVDVLERAFLTRQSDVQVSGSGTVQHILPDDSDGSRHQRFILKLDSGRTLLIAHNIDLAARVSSLARGDRVEFRGEYEWNEKGGVVHWTHLDPAGRHVAGWLRHRGVLYQ